MKKATKKITSTLLALTIILSCFAFVGCTGEGDLGYFKEKQIKEDYIEFFNITDKTADDVVLDYYAGNYEGYEIVMLDVEWHDPEEWNEMFEDATISYYDSNRLYAYKNGEFTSLSQSYKTGELSKDSICKIAQEFGNNVHSYIDTCDVHDFDKSKFIKQDFSKNEIYNKLTIWLEPKMLTEKTSQNFKCLGEHLSMGKLADKYFVEKYFIRLITDAFIIVELTFKYDNKLMLSYFVDKYSQIPGVCIVGPYTYGGYAESATTDEEPQNISWALDSIEIEKVWDFTTVR